MVNLGIQGVISGWRDLKSWHWVEFSRACVEKWCRAETWSTPGLGAPDERGCHWEEVTARTMRCPEAMKVG